MRFLLDTNILIPLEPVGAELLPANTGASVRLARLCHELGHVLLVHPATQRDLARDRNKSRRDLVELLASKYAMLAHPPPIPIEWSSIFPPDSRDENDEVDLELLAAVNSNAADFLVTEDIALHRRARRVSLAGRTLTLDDALASIHAQIPQRFRAPPNVELRPAHSIDLKDPIFASIRADYAGFDAWFTKCQLQHRDCLVIADSGGVGAICVLKDEIADASMRMLKLCTFKVAEPYQGLRYGELLLKAAFAYAHNKGYSSTYVTAYPKQVALIRMFEAFGFCEFKISTAPGEIALRKQFIWSADERANLGALPFHIKFEPQALKLDGVPAYVVPIQPRYHDLLFPDAPFQRTFLVPRHPFANAMRKAYLSRSKRSAMIPGAPLLFYRSGDLKGANVLGIVESSVRSISADELQRFVAKRTVYSFEELVQMTKGGSVLAFKFRQAGVLDEPLLLHQLVKGGVLKAAPQSIVEVTGGRNECLRQMLETRFSWLSSPSTPKLS